MSAMSDLRFPVDVRLIGVMRKEKSKMYITSVLWSDQSEMIVYRSLQDFKRLHRQLKKKFPVEKPFGKEDRVLPHFGARNTKRTFPLKGLVKSVHRLNGLEKYCCSLLQCNSAVSHSTAVIQFFLPNEQELQKEFTQNSVMILQSENIPTVNRGNKCLSIGNMTQPFVSKTYRCVAPYETKDTKYKPFKVVKEERLNVLIKDQAGWWLVENEDKCLAWFPAPYLELCDKEEDEDDFDSAIVEMPLYCATRGYTSKKEDELSLSIGAVVEVLQKTNNGWWLVRYNRKAGYVPSMILKPYNSPTVGLQNLQRKLHICTISTNNSFKQDANSTEPQVHTQYRMNSFLKSCSLEVLSDPQSQYSAPEDEEHEESDSLKNSFSDNATNLSFSSSDTESMSPSMSSSDGEEGLRQPDKEPESDGNESGISRGQSSPTSSESGDPVNAARYPRVPQRPQTQEILSRCTTYTRKAALANTARLFPERACLVDGGRAQKGCERVH
ncbi:NADPH oxidase organizer 1-like [Myxocyprinus asiaticus]|uniref:NADPH oxidase organizer 1-like n=1 Tax=Myxocyprinus asiaticus TaxID=70543 RepID=UPI00222342E3|nr:NADPH oxidase organizer 1-like [Myxocyprinus asiaticus]